MPEHLDVCQRLFEATAAGDAEALRRVCSPDLRASQNGGQAMSLEGLIRFAQAAHAATRNFRYTEVQRSATADGFVEEHNVECELPDGATLAMRVCVVASVADGKVTHLREYADSRAAAPLLRALGA